MIAFSPSHTSDTFGTTMNFTTKKILSAIKPVDSGALLPRRGSPRPRRGSDFRHA